MVVGPNTKRLAIMETKFPRPLKDRILAEKLPNEAKTPAGIILPKDIHKDNRAKVVAIGPEVTDIKIGDVVQYYRQTGVPYFQDNKNYLFLKTSKEHTEVEFVI